MVKNVIKDSFPISKVLVFRGNSYVRGKNEDIRLFYDCNEDIRLFYDCKW